MSELSQLAQKIGITENRLGPETRAMLLTLLKANPSVLYPDSMKSGNWEFRKYGTDCYELIVKDENLNRIVADGAPLVLSIPFPHRWLECFLTHTTLVDVLSETALQVVLSRAANSIPKLGIMQDFLYRVFDATMSRLTISFPPNFQYPPSTYRLALTSAVATDFVYPVITIQRLGL
jgi:hypothetical protein